MGFLVDTSVLSQAAPERRNDRAAEWFLDNDGSLFISVVALSEIRQGIARLRRLGASRKARGLSAWFEETIASFEGFILPITTDIALKAGEMSDHANSIGRNPGYADILIAATARHHEMTVATRNTRHFEPLGVSCLDPMDGA